jgi:hypothetical protein
LQTAVNASEGVRLCQEAALSFGLGYQVKTENDVVVPAYDGSIALRAVR